MKSWSSSAATGASTRGRLLDVEQITRTLAFLAGYRPASVDAVPDDNAVPDNDTVPAGDTAPDGDVVREAPRPPLNGRMEREDGPEPYCTACGSPAGIFLGHGPDWHHFRPPDASRAGAPAELYSADHAPAIGWRYTALKGMA